MSEVVRDAEAAGGTSGETLADDESSQLALGVGTPATPATLRRRLPAGMCLGGRYTIQSHLGEGGMGAVYGAHDRIADHPVALKFIHPHLASDPRARQRLRAELKAALAVSHANVARTHTLEELDGHTFLVMERLDGPTLAARLREGRLGFDDAVRVARAIVAAVAAAHERGVIHRDIKPLNIKLCPDGRAVVMDFGLAMLHERRPGEGAHGHTGAGGTPGYMAPEVVAGRVGDERADVYALGVVLFELFTGAPPIAVAAAARDSVERRRRDLPAGLEALLREMLDADPTRRPEHAGAVAARLEAFAPARPRAGRGWRTVAAVTAAAAAAGAAIATVVALGATRPGVAGEERREPREQRQVVAPEPEAEPSAPEPRPVPTPAPPPPASPPAAAKPPPARAAHRIVPSVAATPVPTPDAAPPPPTTPEPAHDDGAGKRRKALYFDD